MTDGSLQLIYMTGLPIETSGQTIVVPEALLCLSLHEGYSTRLFLSKQLPKALNWSAKIVLGRTWYTWSWQGVPPTHRPAQILAQHLKALR